MTIEICLSACEDGGFTYAGAEYAGECYCGNEFENGGGPAPDGLSGCDMPCNGNSSEFCGGSNRLDTYQIDAPAQSSSSASAEATSSSSSSAVDVSASSTSSTAALTTSTSAEAESSTTSTEADASTTTSTTPDAETSTSATLTAADESSSSALASASATASASSGPTVQGWTYLGCYTDSVAARTLPYGTGVEGPMTNEKCIDKCESLDFTYAGTEYAGECFCGDELMNGGGPAPDGEAQCNMACNGDEDEICGGPNRLSLFIFGDVPAESSSSVVVSSTSSVATISSSSTVASSTTVTASSTTSSSTVSPTGWTYQGCWVDNQNGRILQNQQPDSELTHELCQEMCEDAGYSVAGAQYYYQCFCDDIVRNGGELADSEDECNTPCSGDNTEMCGGPNRMSIWSKGELEVFEPPAAQEEDLPEGWEYQGCITDSLERVFFWQLILKNNNSAETCLTRCQEYGYEAAGMEYGEECYCGDPINVEEFGAEDRPEDECSIVCSGDPRYICGGNDRLSWYMWTGEPFDKWEFAEGDAAGEYQYLVPGVIVPLIATQGRNGKVTFLEKAGTGPPNSTGAYELDLTKVDDFPNAWREMHVKTDVFCAGSVTMPDKVGRQINIGGWSGTSTFGVRIYWPDGEPGEESVNDWQENVNELSLQDGRWYPTAMVMANGSILIAGGEEGSNGPPVPTLEILPKAPGGRTVVTADYLVRTDPYNLYPYLAVMPGGGILICYYNEARILDEETLDTVKVLPNIPSNVNNFLGGRTYPYEGTFMLMPQHAPYTDPIRVLICGGSTPGPQIAVDNCASISPEVEDEWLIERMPHRRVITCMVSLPDGTYIILNGASQGVAGFATASDPIHTVWGYDPTKPEHRRITVMANTTISRMYHSEAILLDDGRVLVSGSDPQDERYPQEMRVEVFVPPYLMGDPARPAYDIDDDDWDYEGTYSVTVTAGSTAGMRATLIAPESSTHGNSMGQRTLFPAISCAGSTCDITAPPDAHTCPPGWFRLFLLNGEGVPSVAKWVRIGGDPAGLGNWPDSPSFQPLPGV
ncbi:hypothetical protein BDY21DRAFT_283734 [Lineolata rhizophorae]|uniref:WSC domain-containing protein n=1 Tax=Lineolata rhizophorae TaxID=578093 RepID=A0A6A6P4P9_9PEZI|nr:hypothetical protein BDY21DRAFT_283734 [Lineolata rhizophorae]